MRMITNDTGFIGVDEEAFGFRFIRKLPDVWQAGTVLQAPNALPWLPVLMGEGAVVIVVRRSIEDIALSVARQKSPEGGSVRAPVFTAEQGYKLWDAMDKACFNCLEINYEDLREHPLWVPKDQRTGWHHKTWRNV
jgi:hypothetical protein